MMDHRAVSFPSDMVKYCILSISLDFLPWACDLKVFPWPLLARIWLLLMGLGGPGLPH